jgi:hypothetical protein
MTSSGTAVRPRWDQLPAPLCHGLAARLGEIAGADVQTGGFTPGLAARLVLADGGRVLVKGIAADHALAGGYRAEARVAHALPDTVPAPLLRWDGGIAGWVVLVPAEAILLEPNASNTGQNITFLREVLAGRGDRRGERPGAGRGLR